MNKTATQGRLQHDPDLVCDL